MSAIIVCMSDETSTAEKPSDETTDETTTEDTAPAAEKPAKARKRAASKPGRMVNGRRTFTPAQARAEAARRQAELAPAPRKRK